MSVEVDEILRNRDTSHFEELEDYGFTVLRLIECGVIIGDVRRFREMRLTPLRQFMRSVPGVDVYVVRSVLIIHDSLIFFNWPENEDQGVVHEGERLAGFPGSKN